jgi:hypothetical protein
VRVSVQHGRLLGHNLGHRTIDVHSRRNNAFPNIPIRDDATQTIAIVDQHRRHAFRDHLLRNFADSRFGTDTYRGPRNQAANDLARKAAKSLWLRVHGKAIGQCTNKHSVEVCARAARATEGLTTEVVNERVLDGYRVIANRRIIHQ